MSKLNPVENSFPEKAKMRFSEHKFYNDQNVPYFEAGKIYDLEGADWIQRWVRRGGEIVEEAPKAAPAAPKQEVVDHTDKKDKKDKTAKHHHKD